MITGAQPDLDREDFGVLGLSFNVDSDILFLADLGVPRFEFVFDDLGAAAGEVNIPWLLSLQLEDDWGKAIS
jgi:hypothetical protein